MGAKKTFLIAPFGLSTHELRVLRTICVISRNRPRTYELGNAAASPAVDFAIVDQDDPDAVAAWQRFQVGRPMVPAVMLAKRPADDSSPYQLARPIMATRLLKLLDRMEVSNERPAFAAPELAEPAQVVFDVQARQGPGPYAQGRATQRKVLVVDDSLPIRRQMALELAPLVDRVDLAEDGEQALAFVTQRTYDMVFLDVVLPGTDGYKICRTIKHDKRTKHTPVIMLTGKSSPFDRVRGKLAGCDTYMTKPVDHAAFERVVKKYLKQRESAAGERGGVLRQANSARVR